MLPNRNQMGNISPASVVAAGPGSSKRFTKSIHFVVPTVAAKMQIIAWIEQSEVIRKILRHLDLWPLPQVQMPDRSLSGSLTYNWGDFLDGSKRTLARIMRKLL